jgi:hypothetical protein
MPLVDLGWYSTDGIPAGLSHLKGGSSHPFDVDGSVAAGLGYKLTLSDHQLLSVGFRVAWLGIDDFHNSRATLTYDNRFMWGFSVGFGWSP